MSANDVDVAVIGGGSIGLAAAYYAAAAGYKTVLFEQDALCAAGAAADSQVRMFRLMYADPAMAMLSESAFALWHEIEQDAGVTLLQRKGSLFYGVSGASVEGDLGASEAAMRALGVPFRHYERGELEDAYPVFRPLPHDYWGISQPSGASVDVARTLRTLYDGAVRRGASLLAHCPASVIDPRPGARSYRIDTPRGRYTATSLIMAPGACSNVLLAPFGLAVELSIWQMTGAYFQVEQALRWPMWCEFGPTVDGVAQHFYGFPPLERPGQIRLGCEFSYRQHSDARRCSGLPDQRIVAGLSAFVGQRFHGVSAEPLDASTCLHSISADGQMVLDSLPGHPNVALLCADGGRAFQFTPLFGRILVQLATRGRSSYNIDAFSIRRDGIAKPAPQSPDWSSHLHVAARASAS